MLIWGVSLTYALGSLIERPGVMTSGRNAIITGTGFEGREKIISRHCKVGGKVTLKREPNNRFDSNAVAVLLEVPRLGGLLGNSLKPIGYIKKHTAKTLAKKMDSGIPINGIVISYFAPEEVRHPRVTVELDQ